MNTENEMIRASCPICGQHVEIEAEHEGEKIPCPNCGQEWEARQEPPKAVAPKYEPLRPSIPLAKDWVNPASQRSPQHPRYIQMEERAAAVAVFSYVLFGIGGIATLIGVLQAIEAEGKTSWEAFAIGGGFFFWGFLTNLNSQLIHIRAALAKQMFLQGK